jgi:hypothetical protein
VKRIQTEKPFTVIRSAVCGKQCESGLQKRNQPIFIVRIRDGIYHFFRNSPGAFEAALEEFIATGM